MIRIAIPTGDLRPDVAALLDRAGIPIPDYGAGSRALRFEAADGRVIARVFREKDIPVQVALGNYDAGICGLAWIEEFVQRFPGHPIERLRDFDFGTTSLWLADGGAAARSDAVRIVSEYGNLADVLARRMRLPRYRVFGVWGAAEAYPPEDADLALIAGRSEADIEAHGLRPLGKVLDCSASLIANGRSLASKDLSPVLGPLLGQPGAAATPVRLNVPRVTVAGAPARDGWRRLRLALPDGHAQSHTLAALEAAGIRVFGYGDGALVRRPQISVDNVEVKVIRPQDMPQQVALGQFDLAVTGRDVLFDHKVQFPTSPVEEVVDLGRSRYGLAAIVKDVQAGTVADALREWRADDPKRTIRIASEFPNIADHFARERHIGRYSVIPINGASEGFVPEDADILIEGIETGSSVRANKLKVLERFFESTNCVIANKQRPDGELRHVFDELVERFRAGAATPAAAGTGA